MRFKSFFIFSILFLLITASRLSAQNGYYDFTNYAGSTSSYGMGEEGVALRNSQDAFTYNPANLTFSDKVRISLFHNPFQIMGYSFPLNNVNAAFRIKGIGTFGLQYLRHEFGEVEYTTSDNPDGTGGKEHIYNYALALGYAGEISDELSMGLVLKYGYENWGSSSKGSMLFSGGLNYQPEAFNKRINLGFSLMNMGAPVKIRSPYLNPANRNETIWIDKDYPVSSTIHFAVSAVPLETDYLSTSMQIGFGKYLINNGSDDSKSSFSALFNDWKDFPQDASLNTGLAFEWKPLDLGNGFSFYQNFYLGTISSGPKMWSGNNYFTHGAEIGMGFKEIKFSVGYSGRWHNVQDGRSFHPQEFPWETFQFSLEWDINKYFNKQSESKAPAALKNILVSLGSGYNFSKGNMIARIYDPYFKSSNSLSYLLEAAFYSNSNNALITGLYYSSIPMTFEIPTVLGNSIFKLKTKFETIGIYSAYRYHPLEVLSPLYIQGGLGIVRINPVLATNPRYLYRTSLNMALGANLEIPNSSLVISPEFNYQMILIPLFPDSSAPRLGGENHAAFALKVGYRF
ncbi:MAG TPA: PorV/PorQ family protein [Ignavibacteriales bacterium]|nr:PorV/PorQ family protein [Ignavibacteriales bacterium]